MLNVKKADEIFGIHQICSFSIFTRAIQKKKISHFYFRSIFFRIAEDEEDRFMQIFLQINFRTFQLTQIISVLNQWPIDNDTE
ncbi:hypothetical protein T11_6635 [Trichinella zimbabwensis]|uniref:Uncharacterized protein n=1 Tax=Trichinella zimbabwensis TaxID=268475 RepID=A0A0V1HFX9_9BILA|nr:hypothetical protein T11_6635 [Trichinella zimbabwensis]